MAVFWTDDASGAGLVHRTQHSGYRITDDQPAALTKRCIAIAEAYKATQSQISPEQGFWLGVATHLEGIAEKIKKRFAV